MGKYKIEGTIMRKIVTPLLNEVGISFEWYS